LPVPILVLTNGRRSCISRTIPSAILHLTGATSMTIINDSPDPDYGQWIEEEFIGGPLDCRVAHIAGEHGYWQAMRLVWSMARHQLDYFGADAVFFLEDDFVIREDVDLTCLARVLDEQPHLTQIALKRQAWFGNEHHHGGLIPALEAQGQIFSEVTDGRHWWIEHRATFTGNPCLIPRRTFAVDWPEGAWSESRFGQLLFADPAARGAYWGHRSDPPRVEHIGHERVGTEY
jgi:hypothetical protein